MDKRYWIASTVVFVIWWFGAGLINGLWLMNYWYLDTPFLRAWDNPAAGQFSEQNLYHYMIVPYIFYAVATVWLYRNSGGRKNWISHGLLFGFMIALVTIIPMRLLNYTTFAFQNGGLILPSPVIVKEIIGWTIMLLLIGVVTAWFYRKPATGAEG
ncbi:hypothetical protein [Sphingobium sp. CAP-1]|uniref:hypothetical protein n=1 Tax=Sphingobium sp. CAP-1 TaxID=2676077 RepID=UPI0012BB2AA0|nr:hypothetical protein [Sphingobium sp. CAP-1]QGP80447.1 hypothetical protein GL174_15020 [Sphingobium sp. CAP-1]